MQTENYILSINAIAKLNNVLKILQNDVKKKKMNEKFQRKELKWQIVFVDSVKWKYVFHIQSGWMFHAIMHSVHRQQTLYNCENTAYRKLHKNPSVYHPIIKIDFARQCLSHSCFLSRMNEKKKSPTK
jgi:hypothetical protein